MEIKIVKDKIKLEELKKIAKKQFGDLIKIVVDIEKEIMAIAGELHADEEALLIEKGSKRENLWGINFYPEKPKEEWIEFDSIVNIRPSYGNYSRGVEKPKIRAKIEKIVRKLVA